eukprot:365469-Chlamydomonas_euryale.AAC.18
MLGWCVYRGCASRCHVQPVCAHAMQQAPLHRMLCSKHDWSACGWSAWLVRTAGPHGARLVPNAARKARVP